MKITVIADVMWNYFLERHPTLPIECNSRRLGGTLISTCTAAKRHFSVVVAIGAVGKEDYEVISRKLTGLEVNCQLSSIPNVSTGACVLIYENETRTNILSFRQANMYLGFDAIDMQDVFTSDFIFVNGWSFLPESMTSKTIIRVLNEAHNKNVPIIFDILPHHIQQNEMTVDYVTALEMSSILICETRQHMNTDRRVLDFSALKKKLKHCKLYILFDWVNRFSVVTRDGHCLLLDEPTNYRTDAEIGFLDEVALRQILKYFRM